MLHRKAKLKHVLTAGAVALALTVSPISAYAAEYDSVGKLVVSTNMSSLVIASAKQTNYQTAKVIIDGKTMKFTQQDAIVKNGSTLVPMREVFNTLNATVSWNQATKTVTAVKGSTKITLTIGSKTAYIGSTKVTLTQTPEVINGATLVPLRFVSEALGAKVNWNQQTSTVTITSAKEQAPSGNAGGTQSEVVNSIKVKHGKHHYESENQAQYDKVMEIVENNLKGYKDKPFYTNNPDYQTSAEFRQGLEDYLNNDIIIDPLTAEYDDYFTGNYSIVKSLKSMVDNGVSKQDAIEAYTIWKIATNSMKEDSAPTSNNTTIRSAYDALVKGLIDCDSWSNAVISFFDSAGYNTAIIAGNNHADPYVQVGGNWYKMSGGFNYYGKSLPSGSGIYQYASPTF